REVTNNARRVLEIMNYEIKGASSVYTPTTDSAQLSLETRKYLPEGEETAYIDFFLCGQQLCWRKESQDPVVLTTNNVEVSNLIFTQVGEAPSIQINLTVDYKNPENRTEYQASISLTSVASHRSY
ncbi:unnamed protein product, partial [marine sediment metagenome]